MPMRVGSPRKKIRVGDGTTWAQAAEARASSASVLMPSLPFPRARCDKRRFHSLTGCYLASTCLVQGRRCHTIPSLTVGVRPEMTED